MKPTTRGLLLSVVLILGIGWLALMRANTELERRGLPAGGAPVSETTP